MDGTVNCRRQGTAVDIGDCIECPSLVNADFTSDTPWLSCQPAVTPASKEPPGRFLP